MTDSEEYQQGTARPGPRPLDWEREQTRPPPPSRGILAGAPSLQMLQPPPYLVVGLGPGEASYVTVFPTATVRWEAAAVGTRLPGHLLAAALHLAGSDSSHLETNHRPSQGCFIAPETQPGAFANHRLERHSGGGDGAPLARSRAGLARCEEKALAEEESDFIRCRAAGKTPRSGSGGRCSKLRRDQSREEKCV